MSHKSLALSARLPRLVTLAVGVVAVLFFLASPAAAHPTLVATLPEAGYSVATAPEEIGLVFDERVTVHEIAVEGQARGDIATTELHISGDGTRAIVKPMRELPDGRYTVRWRVTGEDGHDVDGTFGFGVGDAAAPAAQTSDVQTRGLGAEAALRWAMFVSLAVALGGLVGDAIARYRAQVAGPDHELVAPRPWLLPACLVGWVATAGLAVQSMGGGSLTDGVTDLSVAALLGEPAGRLIATQLVAFTVAVLAAAASVRRLLVLALVAAIIADGLHSHLQSEAPPLGSITVIVHLAAVAIWVGALIHIVRTALQWRQTPGQARGLFLLYSMIALGLYGIVVATGSIAAILVLPTVDTLWTTTYGQVLIAKLTLVAVASALAFTARRRLRRRAYRATVTLASVEWQALVAVLVAAAVLSSIAPPDDPSQGLAYPPPARGPTVRLGTLAGQITTGIIASGGQLEVRLRVPEWDPSADHEFKISGTVTDLEGDQTQLDLEPCGAGCFVSPVRWSDGVNDVHIDVGSGEWDGDTASFNIPWPAPDGQEAFDQMLNTMTGEDAVSFVESATSDTTKPTPFRSDELRTTGSELIDLQPYRSGTVNAPTILRHTGGTTELGFAISAESIYVRQTLGSDGRLLQETLISPNHMLERTYSYESE